MVITLMIGSFVAILNQTLMISALPTLMHEFDVPSSTVQWLTTGFMLTNGIMIPITAFLIETFTAAAMRTGVPEAAASAIGVRASFRTVAIVCAVCLVASLFIRDRGRRLGQQR